MKRLILVTVVMFGGMLGAASADSGVLRNTLRPGGNAR
jgi:hypothetical protein